MEICSYGRVQSTSNWPYFSKFPNECLFHRMLWFHPRLVCLSLLSSPPPSLPPCSPTSPSSSPLAFRLLLPRLDLLTIPNVLLRGALLAVSAHSNLIPFPQSFPWVAISLLHSPLSSGPVNSSHRSFGLCPVIGRHLCLVSLGCHCCLPDVTCLLRSLLPAILSTNWLLARPHPTTPPCSSLWVSF